MLATKFLYILVEYIQENIPQCKAMENSENLIKNANIQEVAEKGGKIYQQMKQKYEPDANGKFLAIEVDSGERYLGNTTIEAVELARAKHPDKVFYVVKIGASASEILAGLEVGV